ncbi:dihydropyrimidinase [bacterium]|nr:MAG: dihydropyrimidinase [bacterium]
MARYDSVILGGRVVLPGYGVVPCDIGVSEGRIAALADTLRPSDGNEAIDAAGTVVFPGGVDAHFHLGIYRDLAADASSETESSLVGGATTVLSYFRTGQHYLNRTGPLREIFPAVLESVRGRVHTDVGFHIAPMTREQLGEIEWLAGEAGVASFKYYFFYKGLNLAADSADAKSYTMSDSYDFGHLYEMMERVAEADAKSGARGRISLSLHCENAELIKLFIERVKGGGLPPLEAYSKARPALTERLSIHEAGVLANAARVRVNLLHLSSREALEAAVQLRALYPTLDVRMETTLHHLCLTYAMLEGKGLGGKVNPPIREQRDVDALWEGVESGAISWIASDHACCMESLKGDELWPALPGFGGTALLYPVLISEGYHKRGLSLERIAELASANPARAFACYPRKGAIAVGADADFALIDLEREETVSAALLHSAQDHTPFEGVRVKGWPVQTILRGRSVYRNGEVISEPSGTFLSRPYTAALVAR